MKTHANPHDPNRPQTWATSKHTVAGLKGWVRTFTATATGRLVAALIEAIFSGGT